MPPARSSAVRATPRTPFRGPARTSEREALGDPPAPLEDRRPADDRVERSLGDGELDLLLDDARAARDEPAGAGLPRVVQARGGLVRLPVVRLDDRSHGRPEEVHVDED